MGHWSEGLVDELAQQIGGRPDRQQLVELLGQTGREIDILAGRSFHPPRRATSTIEPNELPFVDIPDLQVGSLEQVDGVWEIPDPINRDMASVLQVSSLTEPVAKAARVADALWIAGHILATASRSGRLSKDYVLSWLGTSMDHDSRMALMRRVMDPAVRHSIPVFGVAVRGWWIQISRRLIWVTSQAEEDGRLIELLLDADVTDGKVIPLAATEPIVIAVPMTHQPANWAFTARVWPARYERSIDQPWSKIAPAIQGSGIPTITLDAASTPEEIACQMVLTAYWYGYLDGKGPALANAVAMAYPRQVERIQRGTHAPDRMSAAATLLGQLVRPGFDPSQGAEATRRYVRRKANIAVMQHRKGDAPDRYPWTRIGISERRYYKLLPLFAQKANGRYLIDQDDVVIRMTEHLNRTEDERTVRTAALEVLRSHGFGEAAARKWLQRHQPIDAVNAWPRGKRPPRTD